VFFARLLVFRFSLQSLRAEGKAISLFLPTVIARMAQPDEAIASLPVVARISTSCHSELPQLCHPEPTLRRLSPSPSSHCEPKVEQSPLSPSLRGGRSPTKQSPLFPSLRGSLLLVILSRLNYVILSRLCEGSRLSPKRHCEPKAKQSHYSSPQSLRGAERRSNRLSSRRCEDLYFLSS